MVIRRGLFLVQGGAGKLLMSPCCHVAIWQYGNLAIMAWECIYGGGKEDGNRVDPINNIYSATTEQKMGGWSRQMDNEEALPLLPSLRSPSGTRIWRPSGAANV